MQEYLFLISLRTTIHFALLVIFCGELFQSISAPSKPLIPLESKPLTPSQSGQAQTHRPAIGFNLQLKTQKRTAKASRVIWNSASSTITFGFLAKQTRSHSPVP